jgi:S1-C subfamily serine protease
LAEVLSAYRPGDRVVLTVEREGREIEIPVTLGRRP